MLSPREELLALSLGIAREGLKINGNAFLLRDDLLHWASGAEQRSDYHYQMLNKEPHE